jgi:hypothetical protein
MNTNGTSDGNDGGLKRAYETPRLEVEGNIRELTLGAKTGNFLDATFPAHTPFGKLTFS